MSVLNRIALALVIIGAINWGLIGFFRFDLVSAIFGGQTAFLSRVIFGLVGLSGLACIALLFAPIRIEDEEYDTNRDFRRNPDVSTEFGEEADFTDVKKDKNKKKD
ncbi:DUF378 domain-containing protein [Rummeliibacillus pycnus]|uniref:DUF378 domain-containing protein n=1 Tax=Rummeliibacillus pycnus TaxID=101070 RepID=UPI000C9C824B|nr:DUF378 domain-containing protein [Rummeliibacillus pycnus]